MGGQVGSAKAKGHQRSLLDTYSPAHLVCAMETDTDAGHIQEFLPSCDRQPDLKVRRLNGPWRYDAFGVAGVNFYLYICRRRASGMAVGTSFCNSPTFSFA